MAFIEWNEKYSVGVDIIDSQHKLLMRSVNELNEAFEQNKTKTELISILDRLINFVNLHFKTEEEIMIEQDYKDYILHRYEHEKLTDEMKRLYEDYVSGNVIVGKNLMAYFRDWLMDHISAKDKRLGRYLNEQGVK